MLPVPTFNVLAMPHPFRPLRFDFALGHGCTVEDAIVLAGDRGGVPLEVLADAVAILDGVTVDKAAWCTTQPKPGAQLLIRVVPGDPVSLTALVTAIAAASVTPATIATVTGFAVSANFALAVSIGITMIGGLASMMLTPTPRQANTGQRLDDQPAVQSIQGIRNEASPYGTIPRPLGKVTKHYPKLAATPYTEITRSNDQYLRTVFIVGYGPCAVSDLEIANTPLSHFEGVTYEIRQGLDTDTDLRLFPAQVREEALSIELRKENGFVGRTSELESDELSIDIIFGNGLQRIGNRQQKFSLEVEFEVNYRRAGTTPWLPAVLSEDAANITVSSGGRFTIRGNTKAALRRTVRIELPERGQYDVQIRRLTIDDQSDNEGKDQSVTVEGSYWSVLRSYRNDHPLNVRGMTLIALRIKATDQLSGVIDQLSCTVEAKVPIWNGASWATRTTRSPAWAAAEVLRGAANARPLADARLNLTSFIEFAEYCEDEGITFDGVFDSRVSVFEALNDILATGNASLSMSGGLYSIVIDKERDTEADVVQHFTQRNSRNFQGRIQYARRPHGVKYRFPNVRTAPVWDEDIVYADGYDEDNATIFESMELRYITDETQAYKRVRRAMYQWEHRPEIYSLETDLEHVVCEPGDLVRVTHPVPLWGIDGARVAGLTLVGSDITAVELDAPLPMEAGVDYNLRFRTVSYGSVLAPVVTVAGQGVDFELVTPIPEASGPAVGDLVQFGEYNSESALLLVRSIEPRDNHGALLTFIDYGPAIFEADARPVPPRDPLITIAPIINRATPPTPVITSIDSSESALLVSSGGTLVSRIVIGVSVNQSQGNVAAEYMRVRFRESGTNDDWQWIGAIPAQAGSASVFPVQDGSTYRVEVQAVGMAGGTSAWVGIDHTVIGKTSKPPSVERLYRTGDALFWPYPDPPIDLAGFIFRANYGTTEDWGVGRALHPAGTVIPAPPFDISGLHGVQRIMVKAVDTSGNESLDIASVVIDLGDLYVENIVDTQSEAPGFAGTIAGGTVSGSVLQADLLSSPPAFPNPSARAFTDGAEPAFAASFFSELSYIASWTPAADQLNDATLKLDLGVTGDYRVEFRIATSPPAFPVGSDPAFPVPTDPAFDGSTVTEWAPWPELLGPFDTDDDTYQVRITVEAGATQGEITQFDLVVDTPDIEESYENIEITVAASGVRLTPAAARRAIDLVYGLTLFDDGGTAVTLRVIDYNPTLGALIKAYDLTDTVTTAKFNGKTKAH